ncbi:MAG: hydrolase [Pseudomonadota bacterium]|nr:hydrolase [Pseudomonadota bacterium]
MLINADHSCLLVVDIQEKLAPAIHDGREVIANTAWLLRIAGRLGVPVLASQQYPRGLGPLAAELLALVPAQAVVDKVEFSCAAAPACRERIEASGRRQWIVTGMEAHVCVLQTALGLLDAGREVYVVADAVGSRRPADKELGLARLRGEGVRVVSREMVAFEWLHRAGTDVFRDISREFLR